MGIITLTTDFGTGSPYVAAMKGVILSIDPGATIVDITHDIAAQDVREGAIVLADVAERFPAETIHVAVVDPGVGTDRAILYVRIGSQQYVCPDNGLLSRLTSRTPPSKVIRVTNAEFFLGEVSPTFHGRDIMAPVAAHLCGGLDPEQLGSPVETWSELDWPEVRLKSDRIEGEVLRIDSFGNLVTNITADMLEGRLTDGRVCIVCNIYETWGIYATYADQLPGMFIALIGSTGHLELAVVSDDAASRLGIPLGAPVSVSWESGDIGS